MFQIVPVTSEPNQEFQITLQVNDNNVVFKFNVCWNMTGQYWVMRITDVVTGLILLDSIPLLTGDLYSSNLLQAYDYLKIGSAFVVPKVDSPSSDSPNASNLGTEFCLIWDDNL